MMDKNIIKETMLSLEDAALKSARQEYFDYVADARLDRSEPIENDEQAQAEVAADFSEALDDTLHDHSDKLDQLRKIDFGPKSTVAEGALVRLSGRYFIVSVSTAKFTCDGRTVMGISTKAPIFEAIEGAKAGETVEFNGRKLVIEDVA
jgi:transcription elongation GreA/GreB family factor